MFHFQWHITDKCNLRCPHCYQDSYTAASELDRKGLEAVALNIARALRKWGRKASVSLTGGEPFLHADVWWLAGLLDSMDEIDGISFITNGTFPAQQVQGMKAVRKLEEVLVSLDGAEEAVNDGVRGKSAFRDALANIALLRREGVEAMIIFTLMERNYESAFSLGELMKSCGASGYILEKFVPLGRGKKIAGDVVDARRTRELYRHIYASCGAEFDEKEAARYHAFRVMSNPVGPGFDLFGAPCVAGCDGMAVLPDATVLPCRRFYAPFGNLLKDELSDIWDSSEILRAVRKKGSIAGKCGSCALADCRGCRAISYALTGDYLAEDPHCWL